jgi:hypothetical protein
MIFHALKSWLVNSNSIVFFFFVFVIYDAEKKKLPTTRTLSTSKRNEIHIRTVKIELRTTNLVKFILARTKRIDSIK